MDNFHDSHWGQCLELLSHLCQYSDSILLVSGVEGIGKTTMKQALMEQEAGQYVFCEVQSSTSLTAEELTMRIEQDFEVVNDKDLLLLIDDAQFLALDVIAIILQLKQKTAINGRLHIVLFATPDFEQKVSHSVLKEDFAEQIHNIEIEALTVPEVEPFLRQQWRKQHHNNEMPFDRAKCKKIHSLSEGIPGKVQEVAEEMLAGKTAKSLGVRGLSPFTVGLTMSFGILFCILAILWPEADNTIITKSASAVVQPLPVAKQEIINEELNIAATSEAPLIEPTPVEIATAQVQITPVSEAVPLQEKIANLEQKISELQKQLSDEQKAQRAIENKLQQLLAKQQPEKTKKTTKKTLGISKGEKHILSMPGSYYTLQLASMTDVNQVKDFIKSNNLQYKAHYYKTHIKDKYWFVVVYGSYATKADAQAALAKLPAELKKAQPKAREYVNIQQVINTRGKNEQTAK